MTGNDLSARPCGCDPGANWTCVQHALPIEPMKTAKAHFADTMNKLLEEDNRVMLDPEPRVRKYTPPSQEPAIVSGMGTVRLFDTGATRDGDTTKPDYEGFLSPLVIERFGRYMHKHRFQVDGKMRDSDNWQKGIPSTAYMKSGWRHFFDWWTGHRQLENSFRLFTQDFNEHFEDTLCALMFNVMGYLDNHLKGRRS